MVTKKRTAAKARTRTVYRTAPKKRVYRKKSGTSMIPSAMATAALVAVNLDGIKAAYNYSINSSTKGPVAGFKNYLMAPTSGAKAARAKLIGKDALVKDAIAIGGGYVAGEIAKKYAPGVIKRPLAKISKKIPKVI